MLLDAAPQQAMLSPAASKHASRRRGTISSAAWTSVISLSCAGSYALSYFWRYPVFVLPAAILDQPVWGRLDLHHCFSLAFILGFGLAKFPAASVVSSSFFFRHRLGVLLFILTGSMLLEGVSLLFVESVYWVSIVGVFLSSFTSSWLYGMMLTYLEGRRTTEKMLAIITFCLIYAGNASRGTGSLRRSPCPSCPNVPDPHV